MSQRPWLDVTLKAALIGGAVLMYLDLRSEMRSIRSETRAEINSIRSEMNSNRISLEDKIDSVETKIDEIRGYLKYNADVIREGNPPADFEK